MLLAARDENSDLDYDTRTWLNAMAGASATPREVMKETGLNDWLEKELSGSLRTLGDILNGRSAARDVWLDMRPLKAAFSHPAMERWLSQVHGKSPGLLFRPGRGLGADHAQRQPLRFAAPLPPR